MFAIAPESVNVFALPSLPLNWRKSFPKCPAIYFAMSGEKILYIGRASKLVKRWQNHHRLAELEEAGEIKIAWMEVSESKLLPAIEKALIQFFKPPLKRTNIKIRKPKGGKQGRKGGNPETYFKADFQGEISKKPVAVKLPVDLDAYVRSLSNQSEWLRQAVADAYERDMQQGKSA